MFLSDSEVSVCLTDSQDSGVVVAQPLRYHGFHHNVCQVLVLVVETLELCQTLSPLYALSQDVGGVQHPSVILNVTYRSPLAIGLK